jgi:hypothetical protein
MKERIMIVMIIRTMKDIKVRARTSLSESGSKMAEWKERVPKMRKIELNEMNC